ncbi:hypothetical protein B0T16DRAFT_428045 [Cercophora newfieldiana]|uniref:DUF8212 domain-containing protein n=1 Tax=Cercophora newfieldiana TaxID=92897 RepID=A0AA40CRY4_9PEZI|nr:hypothetical protein B0T16DRAFT_428045 [Cercophora newfieldiana]
MRLINTTTLELEEFTSSTPPYAILSHTWSDDEVSMKNMSTILQSDDQKFSKTHGMCAETARIGLNSADLSEAINSMFEWYRGANICYGPRQSRWFTRGWTLQELIAPDILVFFDSSWGARGSMRIRRTGCEWPLQYRQPSYEVDLSGRISDITGVPLSVLTAVTILKSTPAAYSLLGLLDVNLPLFYGERTKAFVRLQEEVLRRRGDLSLLAWAPSTNPETPTAFFSILAPLPKEFAWCRGHQVSQPSRHNTEVSVTHRGLRPSSKLILSEVSENSFLYFF